jgi:CDP-glucose 4,6-dehydratase
MQLASVRAGNVIGGGDWARDRLVPDFLRSVEANETLAVRSPDSIRPWQHVLEPLSGYLILGERLLSDTDGFAEAWNFGPEESDVRPVSWVVEFLSNEIPGARWRIDTTSQPQEASVLKLDCSKAKARLGWTPRWSLATALAKTLEWHEAWWENESMKEVSLQQIEAYVKA